MAGYSDFAVVANGKSGKSCRELERLAGFSGSAVVVNGKTENSCHDLGEAGYSNFVGPSMSRLLLPGLIRKRDDAGGQTGGEAGGMGYYHHAGMG